MRIEVLDLEFQGSHRAIASYLVHGPEGPVLVETGPASTLPTLVAELQERDIRPPDVRDVLVTHIHLDHAGAAGWWARHGATIWVHPRGAPHLIDPGKLLASAERIYGDDMERLWGEVLPAPGERVAVASDRQEVRAGGLVFTALDTPGHARHHHVWRLGEVAFCGDAAGIRLPETSWVDLPAPPPEFDLEAWKATLARLRRQKLRTLYPTHFGPVSDPSWHLDRLEALLDETAGLVRAMMDEGLDRQAMVERYQSWVRDRATAEGVAGETARSYELANPRAMSVDGITRYWRKLAE